MTSGGGLDTAGAGLKMAGIPDPAIGLAVQTSEGDGTDPGQKEEPSEAALPHEALDIPWGYKWVALAFLVVLPFGSNWTDASLSPLKSTLRRKLNVNNAQFGVISSADAFVNTLFPILGGVMLDWWGPNAITVCCTAVIFVGSVVAAAATLSDAWRLLVGGYVLMGFGIAVLDSAQQKYFYHWFGASGLAFAFGLENAIASSTSLVAGMVAVPIRDATGWYGWSFWIPAILCAFSLLANILYVIFERTVLPTRFRLTTEHDRAITEDRLARRKRFEWRVIFSLPWVYLMLPATQLLQSGAAGGFSLNSADMINKRGYTEAVAGYMSTGQKILPIVLSPVVGMVIDVYGHRFHYVALAPVLWIIACSLLGFTDVHPLVALVFSSLAKTINAMPLQICIPLLVSDQAKLGTAFGIWRAFNNAGSTIVSSFSLLFPLT